MDSVFPVPAGPAGAPPRYMDRAYRPRYTLALCVLCESMCLCMCVYTCVCVCLTVCVYLRECEVDAVSKWSDDQSAIQTHVLVSVGELR